MTKITFFKSKTLLVLIPVLILVLLTLGYFFVSNNSQKTTKTSSQNSISAGYQANLISQNLSQGNFASSNSQSSIFPNSTQNANSSISSQTLAQTNSTSSESSYSKSEITKFGKLFSRDNRVRPLVGDSENDVAVIEKCDLAVKLNKKYTFKELYNTKNNSIRINCDVKDTKPPFNDIVTIAGWEGTTPKVINSKDYLPFNEKMSQKVDKVYQSFKGYGPYSYIYIVFEVEDKFYTIISSYKVDLFDRDVIQLQFNSLAPSTPSVKL